MKIHAKISAGLKIFEKFREKLRIEQKIVLK